MNLIPHSKPTLGSEEAEAAAKVARSGMIAQGQKVREFENAFSSRFGFEDSASVSSGTAGLHLALLALDIGSGDEVILPSYACTALLNAVRYTGATPVIADIDPATFNIDPVDAMDRINDTTRAIIAPHMFGLAADLKPLVETGVPVIEDCAQAVGATYRGRPVGSFGTLAVFSFYATKVMTTGEGGMVAGPCELIGKIKGLREYDNRNDHKVRYNYKMTDFQAAIGLVQFRRLDDFIQLRRALADSYRTAFEADGKDTLILPVDDPGHIYYRYVIRVDGGPESLVRVIKSVGIICERPVFMPIHRYLGLKGYANSEIAWDTSVSLPIYPTLSRSAAAKIQAVVMEKVRSLP